VGESSSRQWRSILEPHVMQSASVTCTASMDGARRLFSRPRSFKSVYSSTPSATEEKPRLKRGRSDMQSIPDFCIWICLFKFYNDMTTGSVY